MLDEDLVITALGSCSALATNAIDACAAARAGLSRARPLEQLDVFDPGTGEVVPVVGHVAEGTTDGFTGKGRLVRLGAAALCDLLGRYPLNDSDWGRTAVVLNLATGYLLSAAARLDLGFDVRDMHLPEDPEVADALLAYRPQVLDQILRWTGIQAKPARHETICEDHTGCVTALRRARALLSRGVADRCIVGGVDSWTDTPILEALAATGLLKQPERPVGVIPGEAAAFLVLELANQPSRNSGEAHPRIGSVASRDSSQHFFSDAPPSGSALGDAVEEAVALSGVAPSQYGLIVGNLNGTERLAMQWGTALARISRPLADASLWIPVESYGEVGAAFGFVALATVARAFAGGYARTSHALVWMSSPTGKTAAVTLKAAV